MALSAWLPLIRQEILAQIANVKSDYCILVAPLLLENNLQKLVDRVLVIKVDEINQIARTVARDPSSEEEVRRIIASQMPSEKRLSFADDIIYNENISLKELRQQVLDLDNKYRTMLIIPIWLNFFPIQSASRCSKTRQIFSV